LSTDDPFLRLAADELCRLLNAADATPRSIGLVSLLMFCGLRISEALNANIRDYRHDHGHRVL
jgi:integrase